MDAHIVMDRKAKNNMGIVCSLPAISFFICLVYYLVALGPLISSKLLQNHDAVASITAQHYDTLFIMLAVSGIISTAVLIFCLIHLTRLKNMNGATKTVWVLVLATMVPVSCVLFWLLEIRNEPEYMDVYSDIT
ncbi:hypothetical protein ACTHGU_06960 [Chitinophagaceae bacterium MMS25-I14]